MATPAAPTVFLVDDDPGLRESLPWLLESVGLAAETYATAADFLRAYDPERPGCLVLDVVMPGMSGLDLLDELVRRRACLPIIVLTSKADVPMAVRALQSGAIEFVEKRESEQRLIELIQRAIERDRLERLQRAERSRVMARMARLTSRERQVLQLVAAGQANKQIAAELGVASKTVETHRAAVMRKLEVDSLAMLVRLVAQVEAGS
jgi:FixJ family two-component response regulator